MHGSGQVMICVHITRAGKRASLLEAALYRKLGVEDRNTAVKWARELGLV